MAKKQSDETKNKNVDLMVKEIQEKYGEGAIMKLGEVGKVDVDVIPTGSLSLDLALVEYPEEGLLRFMARRVPAKQPYVYTLCQKLKRWAG